MLRCFLSNEARHDQLPPEAKTQANPPPFPEHSAFESTPWINNLVAFIQKLLAQDRIRIIGVCFGHQIIGRAMDQKVARNEKGWEVTVTPLELTEKGKEVFGCESLVCPPPSASPPLTPQPQPSMPLFPFLALSIPFLLNPSFPPSLPLPPQPRTDPPSPSTKCTATSSSPTPPTASPYSPPLSAPSKTSISHSAY